MNHAILQRNTHAVFSLLRIRAPIDDDQQIEESALPMTSSERVYSVMATSAPEYGWRFNWRLNVNLSDAVQCVDDLGVDLRPSTKCCCHSKFELIDLSRKFRRNYRAGHHDV